MNQNNSSQTSAIWTLIGSTLLAFILALLNRFLGFALESITASNGGAGMLLPPVGSVPAAMLGIAYLASILGCLMLMARSVSQLRISTAFLLLTGCLLASPMLTVLWASDSRKMINPLLELSANNLFGTLGAIFVGAAIGRIIKHPNTLLAAAGFAAFFDMIVVSVGPVRALLETRSPLISAVSVGAGAAASPGGWGGRSVQLISSVTIGPADVLFIAVFLSSIACLARHPTFQLRSERTTFWWMFTLLFAALVSVQLGVRAVPALAPMAAAVLIANVRYAAFTRQEKRDLAVGGAFAAICAGLMIWQGQRIMAQPAKIPDGPIYGFIITRARISNELVVNGVLPDSPALKAGVKPGDVIERIDEIKTGKMTNEEFKPYLAASVRNGGIDLIIRRLGVKGPLKLHVSSDAR